MMAVTRQKTVFLCPYCEKGEHSAEHLPAGTRFGPWYCDECGGSFEGIITSLGIELTLTPKRKVTTVDVLVLPPHQSPVYFVVKGMRFTGERSLAETFRTQQATEDEQKRFFYEEHSCPTNWLQPEMVYTDGDQDPHGLLKFVRFVDLASLPPDQNYGPNDHDAALVRLIEGEGK